MGTELKINKYLPIAFIYFFMNGLWLPTGLFYTSLLCPLFVLWLFYHKQGNLILWFFAATIPYVILHLANGVKTASYVKSYGLFFSVFIFCCCYYTFLKQNKSITHIFKQLLLWNSIFLVVAVLELYFTGGLLLWDETTITTGGNDVLRLRMLASEASVYALILSPIAFYYYLKMLLFKVKNAFGIFVLITLPLILSVSFGVILGLLFTFIILLLSDVKLFFIKRKFPRYLLTTLILLFCTVIVFIYVYPDNVIFKRFINIFEGSDSSFKGRTTDSFYLGFLIADMKSMLFGAGFGQTKELGMDLFTKFYQNEYTKDTIAIPNVIGETIAIFGLSGLFIRFVVIFYLFFKTKVYTNYYRLGLFIFIFIYQFTGSYITNVSEYIIWITAFTAGFHQFDKSSVHQKDKASFAVQ